MDMIAALRGLQVPMLAVLLLGGCAAKGWRGLRTGSFAFGPDGLFPRRLRVPAMIIGCLTEFGLGAGLLLTAGHTGAGLMANGIRAATALFFLIGVGILYEARQHRPDEGCGCFGEFSAAPVGTRAIGRAALLCAAAVAACGAPPLRMPTSAAQALPWLAALAAELGALAALSPELGELLVRLGYSEPCELRRVPVNRTLAALRSSPVWRRHTTLLSAKTPIDVWREGCWRFVVFPGMESGRRVDVVFAVYLQSRRPAVRAAVLDAAASQVVESASL